MKNIIMLEDNPARLKNFIGNINEGEKVNGR